MPTFNEAMKNVAPPDTNLAAQIVQRAVDLVSNRRRELNNRDALPEFDQYQAVMKIVHLHGGACPLHLWRWLMSDLTDFASDFNGIMTNIDTETGMLRNGYWPIFAQHTRTLAHA